MVKITGRQLRMARACLKYRVDDISKKTGVPWARVQFYERTDEELELSDKLDNIIKFFESKKIVFYSGSDDFLPYVKIKK
jgi:predicted transcriptional regulator